MIFVEALLRGFAVGLLGLVLMAALRRASGATRAGVGTIVLLAMLLLPLGLRTAPKRGVAVGRLSFAARPILVPRSSGGTLPPPVGQVDAPAAPWRPSPGAVVRVVWGLGAATLLARTLAGAWTAWGWVRRSRPFQGRSDFRVSDTIGTPCVVLTGRATILLPASCDQWSEARLAAVLAHEAAHVRRRDGGRLLLARLVVALHWPDPFAWALARSLRRSIEDAADDAVLGTGILPTEYADHLLALAATRPRPALVLAMVHRPDLTRRIHHVLNPRTRRGSARLPVLLLAGLLVGTVFVPAASLVPTLGDGAHRETLAYDPDIRAGLTQAGTAENGFVGHLSDGRPVRIVQVSMRTPRGVRAWKPDGTPLPGGGRSVYLLRSMRTILLRYPTRSPHPEGSLGSGPRGEGEPSTMVFAGGYDRPAPKAEEWETASFIGVPKEDGDRSSFTFTLNDRPWATVASLTPAPGVHDDADGLRGIRVGYPETATPFRRDAKGRTVPDGKGGWVHDRVACTGVAYETAEDANRRSRAVAVLRDGGRAESIWNDGGFAPDGRTFRHHEYFDHAPSEIVRIEVQSCSNLNVEFLGVRLRPRR